MRSSSPCKSGSRAATIGLTLGLVGAAGCSPTVPPPGGPGAGASVEDHPPTERRPPPLADAPTLLDEYKDREVASVGEAAGWTSTSAKRLVVVALMLASQDKRVRSDADAEEAIVTAMNKASKEAGPVVDADIDSPANRRHVPVQFRELFTRNARWGWPDRRMPKALDIGDGAALFEAFRSAAARFPEKASFQCQPQTPGGEAAVSAGAEPIWCWHQGTQSDLMAYKLVTEEGRLRIDYVGFFEEAPGGLIRIIGYGNPPPSMVPNKRRGPGGGEASAAASG